jgi:hypothetical protein
VHSSGTAHLQHISFRNTNAALLYDNLYVSGYQPLSYYSRMNVLMQSIPFPYVRFEAFAANKNTKFFSGGQPCQFESTGTDDGD